MRCAGSWKRAASSSDPHREMRRSCRNEMKTELSVKRKKEKKVQAHVKEIADRTQEARTFFNLPESEKVFVVAFFVFL